MVVSIHFRALHDDGRTRGRKPRLSVASWSHRAERDDGEHLASRDLERLAHDRALTVIVAATHRAVRTAPDVLVARHVLLVVGAHEPMRSTRAHARAELRERHPRGLGLSGRDARASRRASRRAAHACRRRAQHQVAWRVVASKQEQAAVTRAVRVQPRRREDAQGARDLEAPPEHRVVPAHLVGARRGARP